MLHNCFAHNQLDNFCVVFFFLVVVKVLSCKQSSSLGLVHKEKELINKYLKTYRTWGGRRSRSMLRLNFQELHHETDLLT